MNVFTILHVSPPNITYVKVVGAPKENSGAHWSMKDYPSRDHEYTAFHGNPFHISISISLALYFFYSSIHICSITHFSSKKKKNQFIFFNFGFIMVPSIFAFIIYLLNYPSKAVMSVQPSKAERSHTVPDCILLHKTRSWDSLFAFLLKSPSYISWKQEHVLCCTINKNSLGRSALLTSVCWLDN